MLLQQLAQQDSVFLGGFNGWHTLDDGLMEQRFMAMADDGRNGMGACGQAAGWVSALASPTLSS